MTVRMDLRLPDRLHARLAELAESERRSVHAQTLFVLEGALAGREAGTGAPVRATVASPTSGPRPANVPEQTGPAEVEVPEGIPRDEGAVRVDERRDAAELRPTTVGGASTSPRVNAPSEFKPDPKPGGKR